MGVQYCEQKNTVWLCPSCNDIQYCYRSLREWIIYTCFGTLFIYIMDDHVETERSIQMKYGA